MKRLLESYIKEVLSEKKIMLKEKPCECAEGEKCECAEGEGKSCGCSEGESCSKCGPSEVDEVSTVGGFNGSPPSITGVVTPLGAGPRGKVRYADPRTKDSPIEGPSRYLRNSNKSNKSNKKKRKTKR